MTSSPSSCGGVENTSGGVSCTATAAKHSKAICLLQLQNVDMIGDINTPSSSATPCIDGSDTSVISSSTTVWKDTSAY